MNVIVFGTKAYINLVRSIRSHIGTLNDAARVLEIQLESYKTKLEAGNPHDKQIKRELKETRRQLENI